MKLFLLALLPFASEAQNPKCYTGDLNGVTKDEFLAGMHDLLGVAFVGVVNDVPKLAEFLKTRGNCQAQCLEKVMKPAMATVYGKMGKKLSSHEGKEMAIEAITGAIRACYPSPPRKEIKKLATAVADGMGETPKANAEFPQGVKCKNAGHESDFPMDDVLEAFGDAFQKVASKYERVKKFFSEEALDCQFPCLEQTVPLTMKTLFLTDQQDKEVGIDALTGSMHACFPGVPSKEIRQLVTETVSVLQNAGADAQTRLYATKLIKFGSSNFFPLCGLVTAMTLVLFFAGVAVGRRWKRSGARVVDDDQVGLMELNVE